VAEVSLQGPRIVTGVSECIPASMAEHVGMSLDVEADRFGRSLDHAAEPGC
jgi:hypothetical protein